ncbi:eukaryotic translation initiation factor 4B isoform X3 [Periplaneta americana]|uniref:eukaryotic translation initiation factor 4B isoform X3 n=1 Tax=Periplaneta americana TaxID=6978 RepID=UPI0037E91380
MASSGKKSKKIKGKTLGLTEFLADGASGPGAGQTVVTRKASNWADDVENEDDYFDSGRKEKVILPTAPRATRSPDLDDEKVPKNPPFLAYISNLSYDVDENDIASFFRNLEVTNIRLPRDERKPKGFGYVEFASRSSLISALSMVDTTVKSRRMRIEVAENNDNDRRGRGRDRGDMSRDRPDGPDRTLGDWRSRPREEPTPDPDGDRGGGFGRDRDGGYERRGMGRREFGSGGFRDGDRFRDNYGDRDRGFENRDNFGDRGRFGGEREGFGDRDRFSSRRGGDRDFGGRSSFGPRRSYGPGSDFEREGGFRGRDEGPPQREPRSRPRLNLKPRSTAEEPAAPAPEAAKASIFGGAKPVDTAAREKEIEERLEKEKGEISRLPPRDMRSDDNRREERVSRPNCQLRGPPTATHSHERSKSGSEYGDQDDSPVDKPSTPRRMEPAPPPKENAWARRSQQNQGPRSNDPIEGNGRVSPHSDHSEHEQEHRGSRRDSPRRHQTQRPESPRRYREPADSDRRPQNARGTPRRQSDDRDDRGGRGPPPRGGGSVRGTDRPRGGRDGRPPVDRDHRRDGGPQDELGRMPKYREHETPNFAGSNKFAYLPDEEDQLNDAD